MVAFLVEGGPTLDACFAFRAPACIVPKPTLATNAMSIYSDAEIPESTARYRDQFRTENIGPNYRGWLHFAFTTAGAIAALVFASSQVRDVRGFEWLVIPISFLIANLGEYLGHRHPMHHKMCGMGLLFRRHTHEHHRFFTDRATAFESPRDFKITLFPPIMLIFFLGFLAAPIAGLLYLVSTANAAWLFATVVIAYFLTYEWLHFSYHVAPDSWWGRLPLMGTLRKHHTLHHDPKHMATCNFNITFPIGDWLFGTVYKPKKSRAG